MVRCRISLVSRHRAVINVLYVLNVLLVLYFTIYFSILNQLNLISYISSLLLLLLLIQFLPSYRFSSFRAIDSVPSELSIQFLPSVIYH